MKVGHRWIYVKVCVCVCAHLNGCMLTRVYSCVFVFDCGFIYQCVSSGLTAPSGVCTLNGWGEFWPLLSIKGSIDWKHESLSAASHPWTTDNGPGHGGRSWKQSTTTEGKCFNCWWNASEIRPHSQQLTALLLIDHVWMDLACLEALLINYVFSVAFYVLELRVCTVSVCLCPVVAEQQGCGLAQSRVVINLTQWRGACWDWGRA